MHAHTRCYGRKTADGVSFDTLAKSANYLTELYETLRTAIDQLINTAIHLTEFCPNAFFSYLCTLSDCLVFFHIFSSLEAVAPLQNGQIQAPSISLL
jgi:hypothetical protein